MCPFDIPAGTLSSRLQPTKLNRLSINGATSRARHPPHRGEDGRAALDSNQAPAGDVCGRSSMCDRQHPTRAVSDAGQACIRSPGTGRGRSKLTKKGTSPAVQRRETGATQLSVARSASVVVVSCRHTTLRAVPGSCRGKDADMKTRLLLIALSSLMLASFADAQTATTVAASPLPPTADYSAFGPFTTSTENNTGPDGTYTIVRPERWGRTASCTPPSSSGPALEDRSRR